MGMKAEGKNDGADNKAKEHERCVGLVRVAARLYLLRFKYRHIFDHATIE